MRERRKEKENLEEHENMPDCFGCYGLTDDCVGCSVASECEVETEEIIEDEGEYD